MLFYTYKYVKRASTVRIDQTDRYSLLYKLNIEAFFSLTKSLHFEEAQKLVHQF